MEDKEAWRTIFQSGDKFYIWVRVGDEVYEIVGFQDIREIASVISQSGLNGLNTKPLFAL